MTRDFLCNGVREYANVAVVAMVALEMACCCLVNHGEWDDNGANEVQKRIHGG